MAEIIQFDSIVNREGEIDISAIKSSARKLRMGVIAPATEEVTQELAIEHTSEPIKDISDINQVSRFLISNQRYRDNMLFIVGINIALRVSDLRLLRFSSLINDNYVFRDSFPVLEGKTKKTRKRKRNRIITINNAVIDAVTLYLENTTSIRLSDYMFRSERNERNGINEAIHRNSIDRILKGIADDMSLGNKMSTHSFRKTFGYHQMVMSGNDPRKLLLLQKMFGHATAAQTLDYIGITSEEIDEAYRTLNLGSETCNYLVDSDLLEAETSTA